MTRQKPSSQQKKQPSASWDMVKKLRKSEERMQEAQEAHAMALQRFQRAEARLQKRQGRLQRVEARLALIREQLSNLNTSPTTPEVPRAATQGGVEQDRDTGQSISSTQTSPVSAVE